MTTGFVIAVEDLEAKDKAFKCVLSSREETQTKATQLLERYENLYTKDRFRINIISPLVEVDVTQRICVKATTEVSIKEQFNCLHELNPFLINFSNQIFEIDAKGEIPQGFSQC